MVWSMRWGKRMKGNFTTAIESFEAYLDDYMTIPEHWANEKNQSKGAAAPIEFHVVRVLGLHGISLIDALNMPYNLAWCICEAHSESNGNTSLVSEADAKENDLIREANALINDGEMEKAGKIISSIGKVI